MLKYPFVSAFLALILIWGLWLTDFHPHLSERKREHASVEDWFSGWSIPSLSKAELETQRIEAIAGLPTSRNNETAESDRPLILYAFFETATSKPNFEFFLKHALHDAADFLFVINGDTKLYKKIPNKPNIRYIRRKNDCYDMGAFAEVLIKDDLYKRYNRFITLNASIRGPFMPNWSSSCWSDMFFGKITEKVKLVGMTLGCRPNAHVQSMIWATDRVGLETLLFPSEELKTKFFADLPPHDDTSPVPAPEVAGINACPHEYWKAVAIEVFATPLIRSAGYEVDVLMTAYKSIPEYETACRDRGDGDVLNTGKYWDMSIHPYDSIFTKTNREHDAVTVDKYTEWAEVRKYSSYDYCNV